MPPALLIRSTAIWVPTRAVLPPAAAAPESGWSVPIRYGFAWPNAARHGGGTRSAAPRAPAARAESPRTRRRVVLPRHQSSRAHGSCCHCSLIVEPPSSAHECRHSARVQVASLYSTPSDRRKRGRGWDPGGRRSVPHPAVVDPLGAVGNRPRRNHAGLPAELHHLPDRPRHDRADLVGIGGG